MDACKQAAEDALMDRQAFRLNAAQFAAFVAVLDASAAPPDPDPGALGEMTDGALQAPVPLADHHDAETFACGVLTLNAMIRRKARANRASGAARVCVLCHGDKFAGVYNPMQVSDDNLKRQPTVQTPRARRVGRPFPQCVGRLFAGLRGGTSAPSRFSVHSAAICG